MLGWDGPSGVVRQGVVGQDRVWNGVDNNASPGSVGRLPGKPFAKLHRIEVLGILHVPRASGIHPFKGDAAGVKRASQFLFELGNIGWELMVVVPHEEEHGKAEPPFQPTSEKIIDDSDYMCNS